MKRIGLRRNGIFFRTRNVQIHDHRLLPAAHDHSFHWLILFGVQLLVRHVGRDVHEVSRTGLVHKLQPLSPAKSRAASNNVDHRFQFAVMMRSRLGIK
jgi:hypothetical protein